MSEVKRWLQYHPISKRPVMCIAPIVRRTERPTCFVLELEKAHFFADPNFAAHWGVRICRELDLGEPHPRRVADILYTILDGLDDLIKMKPCDAVYDDPGQVIGEGNLIVIPTGQQIPFNLLN
jgi:hypothetical protein